MALKWNAVPPNVTEADTTSISPLCAPLKAGMKSPIGSVIVVAPAGKAIEAATAAAAIRQMVAGAKVRLMATPPAANYRIRRRIDEPDIPKARPFLWTL